MSEPTPCPKCGSTERHTVQWQHETRIRCSNCHHDLEREWRAEQRKREDVSAALKARITELEAIENAAAKLEATLDLFDICETGTGSQERWNLRQALRREKAQE